MNHSQGRRAAALLPLLAIVLAASGGALGAEAVTLEFAWPEDLSGSASYTFRRTKEVGGGREELAGSGRAGIAVSPVAGNLLIAFHDSEIDIETNNVPGVQGRIQGLLAQVGSESPDYLVSRRGEFLGLQDPAGFRQAVRAAVDGMIGDMPPETAQQVGPLLDSVLSEAQLTAMAEGLWNRDVGSWVGMALEPGTPLKLDSTQVFPVLGDTELPVRLSYRLVGDAPCGEGGGAGCVELESRSLMDAPEAAAAFGAFLQQIDPSGEANLSVGDYRVEVTARLVTDPDTLVPYTSRMDRVSTLVLLVNGQTLTVRETDLRSIAFDYD